MHTYLPLVTLATSFGEMWEVAGLVSRTCGVVAGLIVGLPLAVIGGGIAWWLYEHSLSLLDTIALSPIDLICRRIISALIGAAILGGLPSYWVCDFVLRVFTGK